MSSEIKRQIIHAVEELRQAQERYYAGVPHMTDAEYDTKEKMLKALAEAHPEYASFADPILKKVGHDKSGRTRHDIPMLSIENQYTEDDFLGQYDRFTGNGHYNNDVCIEPKFDGISVSLKYENWKLVKALTRGDGESGEDITAQVYACPEIPATISSTNFPAKTLEVRGEIVMRKSTLEELNAKFTKLGQKTYSSTRNLAAGTMKLKMTGTPEYVANTKKTIAERRISVRTWDCIGERLPDSRFERLTLLAKDGFSKPEGVIVHKRENVLSTLHALLAQNKKSDIQADGVVMKVDSVGACQKLGLASKYTNYQTCFKPQSAAGTTYLRRVVWQIGRQGKLTPVAECDPVPLAGAMVTRASLNNMTWINNLGLRIGAKVEMLRSGDVIPQIVKVLDDTGTDIVPPTKCPECGSKLETLNDTGIETLWCKNMDCPGQVRDYLTFIGDRDNLEIDGLGPDMASRLVADGYVRTIGELFTFQCEAKNGITALGQEKFEKAMVKKGFSGAAVVKMVASMENAKTADWDRWIAALGVPMLGRTLGKVLAITLKLDSDDMSNLCKKLASIINKDIEGIGVRKREMIVSWANEPRSQQICQELYNCGVRPKSAVVISPTGATPLAGIAFAITGEFTEDRESITRKLVSLGATSKSGVSKNCNLLIKGSMPGKTKLQKAIQLGVKIVEVDWLVETLQKNGIALVASGLAVEEA